MIFTLVVMAVRGIDFDVYFDAQKSVGSFSPNRN